MSHTRALIERTECGVCLLEIDIHDSPESSEEAGAWCGCGHAIHYTCVKALFERSLENREDMPPICAKCNVDRGWRTAIPVDLARKIFSPEWLHDWQDREAEWSGGIVRCIRPGCEQQIGIHNLVDTPVGPRRFRRMASCPRCGFRACVHCNKAWHGLSECELDEANLDTDTMRRLRLRRCPGCGRNIEHLGGCQHMTCKCQTHFCFTCGRAYQASSLRGLLAPACNCRPDEFYNDEVVDRAGLDDHERAEPGLQNHRFEDQGLGLLPRRANFPDGAFQTPLGNQRHENDHQMVTDAQMMRMMQAAEWGLTNDELSGFDVAESHDVEAAFEDMVQVTFNGFSEIPRRNVRNALAPDSHDRTSAVSIIRGESRRQARNDTTQNQLLQPPTLPLDTRLDPDSWRDLFERIVEAQRDRRWVNMSNASRANWITELRNVSSAESHKRRRERPQHYRAMRQLDQRAWDDFVSGVLQLYRTPWRGVPLYRQSEALNHLRRQVSAESELRRVAAEGRSRRR